MIERDLQEKLAMPDLSLKATRDRNSLRILAEARRKAQAAARRSYGATVSAAKPRPGTE